MANAENQTIRRTFAMETGLTDGIVKIVADIAKYSSTSFAERKRISDKYYEIFRNGKKKETEKKLNTPKKTS